MKKTQVLPLPPIDLSKTKTSLPPIGKLPPLGSVKSQTIVSSKPLPSMSSISSPSKQLPSISSLKTSTKTLPPVSSLKIQLPPVGSLKASTKPLKESALPPVTIAPLAQEIKATKFEQIEKISKEIEEKEQIVGVSEDITSLMKPLQALSALPNFPTSTSTKKSVSEMPKLPKLPSVPVASPTYETKTSLMISQEGVETAKLIEPEASFQKNIPKISPKTDSSPWESSEKGELMSIIANLPSPTYEPAKLIGSEASFQKNIPKIDLPPLTMAHSSEKGELISVIASPANLPSSKSRESTPKIRIPKIKTSPVKPLLKRRSPTLISGVELPVTSTVIPPIPITSPSSMTVPKVSMAKATDSEITENMKRIDLLKLTSDRSGKGKVYSVAELKSIAGSLNLSKGGNKKEIVERIKSAIVKVNPNAFQ